MLFIQNITLYWSKTGRSSKGAQVRARFPQAHLLEAPPYAFSKQYKAKPSGVIIQHLHFYQEEQKILNYAQRERKYLGKYLIEHGRTPQQVEEAISRNILYMYNRQFEFYCSTKDVNLVNLSVEPCRENSPVNFEVTFCYDERRSGAPTRNGHNKDYCNPDSRLYRHDILNETAFILKPQQYGRVLWNERLIDYDTGTWYYQLHSINFFYKTENIDIWEDTIFTRQQPNYIYRQMAKLR